MNRRTFLAGAAATPLAACSTGPVRPSSDLGLRLRGRLSTGREHIEASTVFHCYYATPPEGPFASLDYSDDTTTVAEALLFDLGARGVLVGVIGGIFGLGREHGPQGFSPESQAYRIAIPLTGQFNDYGASGDRRVDAEIARAVLGEQEVPAEYWPFFVHFKDRTSLESARFVLMDGQDVIPNESVPTTNLTQLFGSRARMLVTTEVSYDPPSNTIVAALPFLETIQGSPAQPSSITRIDQAFARHLEYHHFKRSA